MSPEAAIGHTLNGDAEILIPFEDGTYQVAWEHSYSNEVFNPRLERFADFVHGRAILKLGGHKLLFGITLNGVCPADCLECPFGKTIMAGYNTLARPIKPAELQGVLERAHQIAVSQGIVGQDEGFAAGALLAGEPGFSTHVAQLIAVVSRFHGCEACRWSTIAPLTANNVLESFAAGALLAREVNPAHTPSFQVSLHSTDHAIRVAHTGVSRLLSMADISRASQQIKAITGRRLSLAFVLHEGSVIDPDVLGGNFSPEDNIISLRPIYSHAARPMDPDRLIELYSRLRADGWDVVYMPPNQESGNNVPPIELHNLRLKGYKRQLRP